MFTDPNFTETRIAFAQATRTASADGVIIDRNGFRAVEYDITVGVAGETLAVDKAIRFFILESDSGAEGTFEYWQSVDSGRPLIYPYGMASLTKEYVTPHPAATTEPMRYTGAKRYTRLRVVFLGTHATGTPISATAKLGSPLKSDRAV